MRKNDVVIVSGANGFVGSHLSEYLREKGIQVVDRNRKGDCVFDITDLFQLPKTRDKVEAIIHLAAKTSVKDSFRSPYETYYTNLLGTLNLLEYARLKKVPKFINVSTYVYGQPKYLPVDESHPVDPGSPYNKSKLISEDLCKFFSDDFNINVVTLRPFYIYGASTRRGSLLHCIIQQVIMNTGTVILSGESTKRDFLFINDFLGLIDAILRNFPNGYNLYNVGYGQSHSLTEVVQIMAKLLKKEISIRYDTQIRPNDVTDMVADISKVVKDFDWKPSTSLYRGLEHTLSHYR